MESLNSYFLTAEIADISTESSTFVAIPDAGEVVRIDTILEGTIDTADAAITFEIGGAEITGSAITVAYDGSAAGDADYSLPTAANTVLKNGSIEIVNAGASGQTMKCAVTFTISRTAK